MSKILVERISISNLKIEKVKFFTQVKPKFFALAILTLEVA